MLWNTVVKHSHWVGLVNSCVQSVSVVFMSILFSSLCVVVCPSRLTAWTCAPATDCDPESWRALRERLKKNTSHAVTRPRMVAELVVAFTDPRSFWYSGAAASLLLDGGICSVIEHQQDQLMYQQMVIDEAGAARTPVLQCAQEYRGKLVEFRIGNKLETLAVDEKLDAELVDVEANALGELSLPGMIDVRKKRAEQLAFMLLMHKKNRATQMITRLSDPVNGLEIWRRFLEVGAGEQRSISSDADAIVAMSSHGKQRSSLGGVGTSCTAVRGAEFGHDQSSSTGAQPTGFRVVQMCQTERDEAAGVWSSPKCVERKRQRQAQRQMQRQSAKAKRKANAKAQGKEKARINRRKEHQTRRTRNALSARERIAPTPWHGQLRRKQWVMSWSSWPR